MIVKPELDVFFIYTSPRLETIIFLVYIEELEFWYIEKYHNKSHQPHAD